MTPKDEKTLYDTLESLSSGTDVPPSDEEYLLEEILAEYGAGRGQKILRDVEEKVTARETGGQRNRLHPLLKKRRQRRSLPGSLPIRQLPRRRIPHPQSAFPSR